MSVPKDLQYAVENWDKIFTTRDSHNNTDTPEWTVLYSLINGSKYVGTAWEFFDSENQADDCYDLKKSNGFSPTKRPFNEGVDRSHMGAVHRKIDPAIPSVVRLKELKVDYNKLSKEYSGPDLITHSMDHIYKYYFDIRWICIDYIMNKTVRSEDNVRV